MGGGLAPTRQPFIHSPEPRTEVYCFRLNFNSYGNGANLLVFKVLAYGRTDVRTDSHVTTKIFQIDGLPNFLRYVAPFARFWRAGARLIYIDVCTIALVEYSNSVFVTPALVTYFLIWSVEARWPHG